MAIIDASKGFDDQLVLINNKKRNRISLLCFRSFILMRFLLYKTIVKEKVVVVIAKDNPDNIPSVGMMILAYLIILFTMII